METAGVYFFYFGSLFPFHYHHSIAFFIISLHNIFFYRNANRNVNEIDLHGLHVAEALRVLEQMLAAWKPGGMDDVMCSLHGVGGD